MDQAETINIEDGKFTCVECENEVQPNAYNESGELQPVDMEQVQAKLAENVYMPAVCEVCGMEYKFVDVDGGVKLQASDEPK